MVTQRFIKPLISLSLALAFVSLLVACGNRESPSGPVRTYSSDAGLNWEFDQIEGWHAYQGIRGVKTADGILKLKAKTDVPVLFSSPDLAIVADEVDSIVVRMKASEGTSFKIFWEDHNRDKYDGTLRDRKGSGHIKPPLRAGDDFHVYKVVTQGLRNWDGKTIQRLAFVPTDAEGAKVEIDYIRVRTKRAYYRENPHGCKMVRLEDGIDRDAYYQVAPGEFTLKMDVPESDTMCFSIGTESGMKAIEFELSAVTTDPKQKVLLFEKTVEASRAWSDHQVDVSKYSGDKATFTFKNTGNQEFGLAYWSKPRFCRSDDEPKPNVIVYLQDAVRMRNCSAYGYELPTTPRLARLAKEGVQFSNCLAPASYTRSSVASLFSSLYLTSHGVRTNGDMISDRLQILPELVRDAGFVTAGFIANIHAGYYTNMVQGYDYFYQYPKLTQAYSREEAGEPKWGSDKSTETLTRLLSNWLEKHADDRFFIYVHTLGGHEPYEPPREYYEQFARSDPHGQDLYDAELAYHDQQMGIILDKLEELGLSERTLFVATSDHGQEFMEHGYPGHGSTTYNDSIRIPLIMRYPPGFAAGKIVDQPANLIDILPTVLDFLGIPVPSGVYGRSLLPHITDDARADERALLSYGDYGNIVTLIKGDRKLIVTDDEAPELYSFRDDPLEQSDLSKQEPEVVQTMKQDIDQFLELAPKSYLQDDAQYVIDQNTIDDLKALGYLK